MSELQVWRPVENNVTKWDNQALVLESVFFSEQPISKFTIDTSGVSKVIIAFCLYKVYLF